MSLLYCKKAAVTVCQIPYGAIFSKWYFIFLIPICKRTLAMHGGAK